MIAAAIAFATALGFAAVGWGLAPAAARRPERLATAFALGAVAVPPVALAAGALGIAWTPRVVLPALALVAALAASRRAGASPAPARLQPALSALDRAAIAVAVLAVAVALVRQLESPLWSWDHFAIWGVKARRMAPAGTLELARLASPALDLARPDHPLALPALWDLLAGGGLPGERLVRATHAALGVALALVVGGAAGRAARSVAVGSLATAAIALSPLLRSSGLLGLAELPLALALALAAAARLSADPRAPTRFALAAGALPWIKQEGWLLALLLAGVLVVAPPAGAALARSFRRRFLALAVPGALAALAFQTWALPRAPGFLAGDWAGRLRERLPRAAELAGDALSQLVTLDWHGLWLLAPLGLALAIVRRCRLALALQALAVLDLGATFLVVLAANADPFDQLHAAYARVAAPLLVPVVLGWVALATPRPGRSAATGAAPG